LGGSYLQSYGGNMTFTEKTAIAAVIGGTAEALGGGKFANGAVTGAFVEAYNHLMHEPREINQEISRETVTEEVSMYVGIPDGEPFSATEVTYRVTVAKIKIGIYRDGKLIDTYYNLQVTANGTSNLHPDLGKFIPSGSFTASAGSIQLPARRLLNNTVSASVLNQENWTHIGSAKYYDVGTGPYNVNFTGSGNVRTNLGSYPITQSGLGSAKAHIYISFY